MGSILSGPLRNTQLREREREKVVITCKKENALICLLPKMNDDVKYLWYQITKRFQVNNRQFDLVGSDYKCILFLL